MRSRVLLIAAVCFGGAASAQLLSAPLALDTPSSGPAGGIQRSPAVAWTGLEYLAVWEDWRDGSSADLWFSRLDGSGRPLTQRPAPLVRRAGHQRSPEVVAGLDELLVAWRDDSVGCASEIHAQSFTPSGAALAAAQRLSTGACTDERPAMAFDSASSRWLVAWGRHGAGREVHGALLGAGGQVLVPDFVIAAATNGAVTPAVTALAAGGFAVAWSDDRVTFDQPNVYLATVSSTGVVGAAQAVAPAAAAQRTPALRSQGSGAFVAWEEGGALKGLRLTAALTPAGGVLTLLSANAGLAAAAELPLGTVLVAYEEWRNGGFNVFARTVSDAGVVSGEHLAAPRVGYFSRANPRVTVGAPGALVVAEGDETFVSALDVQARAFVTAPQVELSDAGVQLVSLGATPASRVRAAWDGARYFVSWRDDGIGVAGADGVGQLVEPGTGAWLGSDAGLRLTTDSANLVSFWDPAGRPGGGFFSTWGDSGSAGLLQGCTVSPTGVLGATSRLSDSSSYVNVFTTRWHRDAFFTVFLKDSSLRLRRTSATGSTLQPETVRVPATNTTQEQLAAASAGDALLVAFLTGGVLGGTDVSAVRLDADGGLLDATPVLVAGLSGDELDPAVGAGPTNALVAWAWSPDGGALAREVFATRVSRGGAVLDAPPLRLGPGQQPAVSWLGTSYLVAWNRGDDVVAARVGEQGSVLDTTPFVVAAGAEVERLPGLSAGPAGEVLATWEAFEPSLAAFRARGRFVWDQGLVDAGAPDAGAASDAGLDAGAGADGGDLDGGDLDGGDLDGGDLDGGDLDGGDLDGGDLDGGLLSDGGTTADAGSLDAGAPPDGGSPPREPSEFSVGCGCAAVDGGTAGWLLALLGLGRKLRARRGARHS